MEKETLKNKEDVVNFLEKSGIKFKEYKHAPALTIEDLKNDPKKLDKSPFIKNLIYLDNKKVPFFLVVHEETVVGKSFWNSIGSSKNKVRFCSEDFLSTVLLSGKGSVNLFSVLNDKEHQIKKIYFDKKLENCEYMNFHPQENTSLLELSSSDCLKFLDIAKRAYAFIDMEEKEVEIPKVEQDVKGETKLKIDAEKEKDFPDWYSQLIIKAELIDYYDISGCYIYRPTAYFLWEKIQFYLDAKFKTLSVKNVYFPMFVKKEHLEREKDHLEGFEAEVAWVTHSGKSKLAEPIAIRPTSETIMYPYYSKWIKSHRDLPLLLNQWTNIVRWEFKHPTPFIRTREFLWQEGHTAHATKQESDEMVYSILDIYEKCYKELLAVPVIKGIKTESEKFAGADYTTTCETFIPENGRAIQACTSHSLGQNFAKMFNIEFENKEQKNSLVWQTSWGFTTRSIGIVLMIHGDNKGAVFPPKIAPIQIIIVPIYFKEENNAEIDSKCSEINNELKKLGIRSHFDDRDSCSSGRKFNEWELKGVPIRIELGPKDLAKNEVKLVRRFDGLKVQVSFKDIYSFVEKEFEAITGLMYQKAHDKVHQNIEEAFDWENFMLKLNNLKVVNTPFCDFPECEAKVKEKSAIESKNSDTQLSGSAKTLCKPLNQKEIQKGTICFNYKVCGNFAATWVLWGRSY